MGKSGFSLSKAAVVEELNDNLKQRVVGQDEAVNRIVENFEIWQAGLCDCDRPIGTFLFMGPTGTGKTALVKNFAKLRVVTGQKENIKNDSGVLVEIRCEEFKNPHDVARIIGAPPGYIGHERPPLFDSAIFDKWYQNGVNFVVVLFDEIEKAHPSLWDTLLGIMNEGILGIGTNKEVNFAKTMIFMTSNVGAREVASHLEPSMGFTPCKTDKSELRGKIKRSAFTALRREFTPEFLGRIETILVFNCLDEAQLERILDIQLSDFQNEITGLKDGGFILRFNAKARNFLVQRGTDLRYGARPLIDVFKKHLKLPVARFINRGEIGPGDMLEIDHDRKSDSLKFNLIREGALIQKAVPKAIYNTMPIGCRS